MSEYPALIMAVFKQYGLPGLILLYLGYKELNMFKKKRNGKYVSYSGLNEDLRQIQKEFESHKEEDRKMLNELNNLKAQQIELGRRLEDNVQQFRGEIREIKTDIREVRDGIGDIKDILIQRK